MRGINILDSRLPARNALHIKAGGCGNDKNKKPNIKKKEEEEVKIYGKTCVYYFPGFMFIKSVADPAGFRAIIGTLQEEEPYDIFYKKEYKKGSIIIVSIAKSKKID